MANNGTRTDATQSFFVYVNDTKTGAVKRMAVPADVQIGLAGRPAELQLFGRFSIAGTNYDVNAVNKGIINVLNDDTIVAINMVVTPVSGRIKVYLPPSPRDGQLHFVKDMTGTSSTVPVDVVPSPGATIDNQAFRTLSDPYGSLALVWLNGQWRLLVAGLGSSGGGGAPTNASYVTINPEASLTAERHLTGSANIRMTDQGPEASVFFDLSQILGVGAGTFTNATVTADAYGRVTAISNGAAGPPLGASYITVSSEPGLTNERVLTGSLGVKLVDGGTNTGITASIDATFFVAGPGVTISTGSNRLTISSVAVSSINPWTDLGLGAIFTTSSVSIDRQGRFASAIGSDTFFFVSGTSGLGQSSAARRVAVFGGDVVASASIITVPGAGFTGSLTRTAAGNPFLVGAGGISMATNSLGQVTVTAAPGITILATGVAGTSQASYYGYTTGSVWWKNTGSWTPFTASFTAAEGFNDTISAGIFRTGSSFYITNGGLYYFHANFNAYGSDAYISMRLSGSRGTALSKTTYRTNPTDQNQVVLEGIFTAPMGDVFNLEYITSGTTFAWTGSNPIPGGELMRTGEVSMFLITPGGGAPVSVATGYFSTLTSSLTNLTGSTNWTTLMSLPVSVTGSASRLFINYSLCSEKTSSTGGTNFSRITLDGVQLDSCASTFPSGSGTATMASVYLASASFGNHTLNLDFRTDTSNSSIVLGSGQHANVFVQEVPQVFGGGANSNLFNLFNNRPPPGTAGRLFFSTESPVNMWVDNGTAWQPFIGGQVLGVEPPAATLFSAQNGATLSQLSGALLYTGQNDGVTATSRPWTFPLATSSLAAWIETAILYMPNGSNTAGTFSVVGPCMRESSTARMYAVTTTINHNAATCNVESMVFTSNTARTIVATSAIPIDMNGPLFLRVRRDSLNIYSEWSRDRNSWVQLDSRSLTVFSSLSPDQVGITGLGINIVPRAAITHLATGTI